MLHERPIADDDKTPSHTQDAPLTGTQHALEFDTGLIVLWYAHTFTLYYCSASPLQQKQPARYSLALTFCIYAQSIAKYIF